jgi:hypothetical protein
MNEDAKKDRDAARRHEVKVMEKGTVLQKITPPILAIVAVIGTMAFFFLLVFQKVDGMNKDIVLYMLGVLSTIVSQIFAYYFGSSAGSKAKQDQINKMKNNGQGA